MSDDRDHADPVTPDQHVLVESLFASVDVRDEPRARRVPFKFLDPYEPDDRDIFFGRDYEIDDIYSRFFRSRLLVVYGESGSGKTSLIQCGLRSRVRPEDALFLNLRAAIDPIEVTRRAVQKLVGVEDDGRVPSLPDLLREATFRISKTLVLVFDQFEEFFLQQSPTRRQEFVGEVASWLAADIDVRIIIGIRQEYLAQLSELEPRLPQLYGNRVWVRRIAGEQVRDLIAGPCKACGIGFDEGLVREIEAEMPRGGEGVDLPILQVVLDKLHRHAVEVSPDAPVLSLAVYEGLGKVESILGRFVEERTAAFPDVTLARQVLKAMVTPDGTKRVVSVDELERDVLQLGPAVGRQELDALLRRLVEERLVREDAENHLFELRHDALATTIHGWLSGFEKDLLDVKASLENRHREYVARKRIRAALLDEGFLEYVTPYLKHLRVERDVDDFVQCSRRDVRAKAEEELAEELRQEAASIRARERATRVMRSLVGAAILCALLVALALTAWVERRHAEESATAAAFHAEEALREAANARRQADLARESEKEAKEAREAAAGAEALARGRYQNARAGVEFLLALLSGETSQVERALKSQYLESDIRFLGNARPLGFMTSGGPAHRFEVRPVPETLPGGLDNVESVTYWAYHLTFSTKVYFTDRSSLFTFTYKGWGCLTRVVAIVMYKDPDRAPDITRFNMCSAIGWQL